jgi:O-acetyl-ADP-ribose deacetylase (regulator of RNase III)
MPEPQVITGNIFTSTCQTLVNTVNCVGVMGAGIALEFRLRYPEMFTRYVELSKAGKMAIGTLWLYKGTDRWVLNFPTKQHWRFPAKVEYLHAGLDKFMATYEEKGIESIAFPLLGTHHGGLEPDLCMGIMQSYLRDCRVPVEIYYYDPAADDDLYEGFKIVFLSTPPEKVSLRSGLQPQYVDRIREALGDARIKQMNQLAKVKGVGPVTLERAFAFARSGIEGAPPPAQQSLDVGV